MSIIENLPRDLYQDSAFQNFSERFKSSQKIFSLINFNNLIFEWAKQTYYVSNRNIVFLCELNGSSHWSKWVSQTKIFPHQMHIDLYFLMCNDPLLSMGHALKIESGAYHNIKFLKNKFPQKITKKKNK